MFEDFVRHSKYRQVGLKRSRFEHLVDLQVRQNLLREVERKRGRDIEPKARKELLRRARDIIKDRPLPEETYEIWHSGDVKEEPERKKRKGEKDLHKFSTLVDELEHEALSIETRLAEEGNGDEQESDSASESDSLSASSSDEEEETEVEEDTDHLDAVYAARKLKKWENDTDTSRSWAKDRFVLTKAGWEFPGLLEERKSVVKNHISNVLNLLHINMLRQRWELAYKAFCILIRFDYVDIRAIWPLGVEILTRRREDMIHNKTGSKLDFLKCRQFLDWLGLVYPVLPNTTLTAHMRGGPVFRSRSRRHAPAFIAAGLWELLIDKSYTRLRESLEELLLVPPYSIDGSFYYIQAVCCLCENIHLADMFVKFDSNNGFPTEADIGDLADDMMLIGSKEAVQARILSNISTIEELVASCESLGFEYPKSHLDDQMTRIKLFMEGKISTLAPDVASLEARPEKKALSLSHGVVLEAAEGPHTIPTKFLDRFVIQENEARVSWVWYWFKRTDGSSARCLKCGENVKRELQSSTKSLIRHLANHNINNQTEVTRHYSIRTELDGDPRKTTKKPVPEKAATPDTSDNRDSDDSHSDVGDSEDDSIERDNKRPSKSIYKGIPSPPITAGDTSTKVLKNGGKTLPKTVKRSIPESSSSSSSDTEAPPGPPVPTDIPEPQDDAVELAPPLSAPASPVADDPVDSSEDKRNGLVKNESRSPSPAPMPLEPQPESPTPPSAEASPAPSVGDNVAPEATTEHSGLTQSAIAFKQELVDELENELSQGYRMVLSPALTHNGPVTPPPVPFSPEPDSPESQTFMSVKRKPVRRQVNFSPESSFAESQGDSDMSLRFREYADQAEADPFRVDRSMLEDTEDDITNASKSAIQLEENGPQSQESIPDTLRFKEELDEHDLVAEPSDKDMEPEEPQNSVKDEDQELEPLANGTQESLEDQQPNNEIQPLAPSLDSDHFEDAQEDFQRAPDEMEERQPRPSNFDSSDEETQYYSYHDSINPQTNEPQEMEFDFESD